MLRAKSRSLNHKLGLALIGALGLSVLADGKAQAGLILQSSASATYLSATDGGSIAYNSSTGASGGGLSQDGNPTATVTSSSTVASSQTAGFANYSVTDPCGPVSIAWREMGITPSPSK
jgi:hypothetical protein